MTTTLAKTFFGRLSRISAVSALVLSAPAMTAQAEEYVLSS